MSEERSNLHLTLRPTETPPEAGATLLLNGMVVKYAVTIHRVFGQHTNEQTGNVTYHVDATKRMIEE